MKNLSYVWYSSTYFELVTESDVLRQLYRRRVRRTICCLENQHSRSEFLPELESRPVTQLPQPPQRECVTITYIYLKKKILNSQHKQQLFIFKNILIAMKLIKSNHQGFFSVARRRVPIVYMCCTVYLIRAFYNVYDSVTHT